MLLTNFYLGSSFIQIVRSLTKSQVWNNWMKAMEILSPLISQCCKAGDGVLGLGEVSTLCHGLEAASASFLLCRELSSSGTQVQNMQCQHKPFSGVLSPDMPQEHLALWLLSFESYSCFLYLENIFLLAWQPGKNQFLMLWFI